MRGRYIKKRTRETITLKHGHRCAFPGCRRPAIDFHHVERFSIYRRHRVEKIKPICKIHHELAHAGLIKNEEEDASKWYLRGI